MKQLKKVVLITIVGVMILGTLLSVSFLFKKQEKQETSNEVLQSSQDDVALRFGVISDLHLQEVDTESAMSVRPKIWLYANAASTLNQMAGEKLDAFVLAGDYCGTGSQVQGMTFANATRAILNALNEGKDDKDRTRFLMAYGNHETEVSGQMNYTQWENLLDDYRLLDDVQKGPTGCYHLEIDKGEDTYHFFSLETEAYVRPTNMFLVEALEWLDEELEEVTTKAPHSYVYVISHGLVADSGIYGSDLDHDKNAEWGTARRGFTGTSDDGRETSSDLAVVLEKYPQVIYFSGHTHYTNVLESTIMSDKYTAVSVSALNYSVAASTAEHIYLDDIAGTKGPGYGLYVEVMKDGSVQITRFVLQNKSLNKALVEFDDDTAIVSYVEMTDTEVKWNTLPVWTLSTPNDENTHLDKYRAETRRHIPVFDKEAKLFATKAEDGSWQITFDTATCETYIIRYVLEIYAKNGELKDTRWVLGNWISSHVEADELSYKITIEPDMLNDISGGYIRIYAVDEFGGKSETLEYQLKE